MIFIQSAHHWHGREGYRPRYIILHGTAGGSSTEAIANYFAQPSTQASTHYVIGQDGKVIQCVKEEDAAWANGAFTQGHSKYWNTNLNPNLVSIAIEHVKSYSDNSNQLTEPQKQASFKLINEICTRWRIPRRWADAQGGITGHFSIDPINRSRCPGSYPWTELFLSLNQGAIPEDMLHITDPFAATFFKEMNGRWFCAKTNKTVLGAILTFYRQIQGAPRLPLTEEIKDVPGIIYQVFEGGIICYDPQKKLDAPNGFTPCYLVKLSHPLAQHLLTQPLQDQLRSAQVQIASLQEQLQTAQTLDHATLVSILNTLQPFVSLSNQIQKVVNQ